MNGQEATFEDDAEHGEMSYFFPSSLGLNLQAPRADP